MGKILLSAVFMLIISTIPSYAQFDSLGIQSLTVEPGGEYSFAVYGHYNSVFSGFEIPLVSSSSVIIFDSVNLHQSIVPNEYELGWRTDNQDSQLMIFIFPGNTSGIESFINPPGGKICEVYFHVLPFAANQTVIIDTMTFVEVYDPVDSTPLVSYDLAGYDQIGSLIDLEFKYGTIEVDYSTDIENPDDFEGSIPDKPKLFQNYPNPFNPVTNIEYCLSQRCNIRLDVLNLLGQTVRTLYQGSKSAGCHSVAFNAGGLSSGVYLYRLQADDFVRTRRMTLLK